VAIGGCPQSIVRDLASVVPLAGPPQGAIDANGALFGRFVEVSAKRRSKARRELPSVSKSPGLRSSSSSVRVKANLKEAVLRPRKTRTRHRFWTVGWMVRNSLMSKRLVSLPQARLQAIHFRPCRTPKGERVHDDLHIRQPCPMLRGAAVVEVFAIVLKPASRPLEQHQRVCVAGVHPGLPARAATCLSAARPAVHGGTASHGRSDQDVRAPTLQQ
jgi:hypothetical protein